MTLVPDLLREQSQANPDRRAVVIDGVGEMTYRQWENRSNRVARELVRRGLEPGQRVGILFGNPDGLDYLVCYHAVHKAGGVTVPLNVRATLPEQRRILEHAEASGLLHAPTFAERAAALAGSLSDSGLLLSGADIEGLPAQDEEEAFQVSRAADDLADILYTSGTTGEPKGVACTHSDITFKGQSQLSTMFAGATFLHAVPLFTFAGTHAMSLICLRGGMTHLLQARFEPARFLELISEQRVHLAYAVPTMLLRCLEDARMEEGGFESLRLLMYGTAPMPPPAIRSLAQHMSSTFLINLYGLTEGGAAVCSLSPEQAYQRPGSIGRPMPPTELRVVDEDGMEVPSGEEGEIQLRSSVRQRSYWKDPEATAETWTEGGWLRTGDLGRMDEEGYLYLVDRKKDLIIVGGHNVSAPEVEAALLEHPAVREAALVGIKHPQLGEVPRAFVVPVDGPSALPEDLEAFLRERLADYKVPRTYTFVDDLPRNALGKVLKRVLRAEAVGA
ncbi:MAG: class I adenylate-forming enzyme family protein [Myxococcota bacterium]|nr:class I adenylate-forming enzyme family protein [Myxococcota bacterium]